MKITVTPLALRSAIDLEQPVRLGERQARRRLVHDDEPRIEGQRLGDFDQLPLGDGQIGDRGVGLEFDAEPVEQRLRRGRDSALRSTSFSGPPQKRLAANEDIGGDVEIVEKIEFLMDKSDAGGRGVRRSASALDAVDADRRPWSAQRRRRAPSSKSICRRRSRRPARSPRPGETERVTFPALRRPGRSWRSKRARETERRSGKVAFGAVHSPQRSMAQERALPALAGAGTASSTFATRHCLQLADEGVDVALDR